MKKLCTLLSGLLFVTNVTFSQFKLNIELTEIKNDKGKIMLQLFDINEKLIAQEIGIIKEKKCSISIGKLKPGKYAVRYYHDENLNGIMETNLLDKPTEGYGFSNNVIEKFGPPPFKKWLFEIREDTRIELKPTY